MPSKIFEMCLCPKNHGFVVRPSGLKIEVFHKETSRGHLNDMWKAKLLTAAQYMAARNEIENSSLRGDQCSALQPDDPVIEITKASATFQVFVINPRTGDQNVAADPSTPPEEERSHRLN